MSEFIFAYITFENPQQAEIIAETLVTEQLAACVNIFPAMRSIYNWQDKLQYSNESVGIAKTKKALFAELKARVQELHSYETPCIVSLDIKDGNEDFLSWLAAQTK